MSRGHGKLQGVLLAIIRQHADALDTITLAGLAHESPPGPDGGMTVLRSHVVSTQRALSRLAEDHLVCRMGRRSGQNREHWLDAARGIPLRLRQVQQEHLIRCAANCENRTLGQRLKDGRLQSELMDQLRRLNPAEERKGRAEFDAAYQAIHDQRMREYFGRNPEKRKAIDAAVAARVHRQELSASYQLDIMGTSDGLEIIRTWRHGPDGEASTSQSPLADYGPGIAGETLRS